MVDDIKAEVEAPRRGRPPRVEQERQRRRKRDALSGNTRLAVDENKLDRENFDYRWIKSSETRMYAMTQNDDWNPVTQDGGELKENATDLGSVVSVLSGTDKTGAPERLILCRKPRDWAEADRAEKEKRRVAVEKQTQDMGAAGDPTRGDAAFYRDRGNRIG